MVKTCRTCPNPTRGDRKWYCQRCLKAVAKLYKAVQKLKTRDWHRKHRKDRRREYHEQLELVRSLDSDQMLRLVGFKDINPAQTALTNILRVSREKRNRRRYGSTTIYPIVMIPDKNVQERTKELVSKKYKVFRKGSKII